MFKKAPQLVDFFDHRRGICGVMWGCELVVDGWNQTVDGVYVSAPWLDLKVAFTTYHTIPDIFLMCFTLSFLSPRFRLV